VVRDMLEQIDSAEGIQRKGLVLSSLTKLKQICNHPAHFLADNSVLANRSGKLARLEEMLEEVVAAGDHALVFTQYAEWGRQLQSYLRERLGKEVLYLHGGTPRHIRDRLVNRFQNDRRGPQVFILSLKAGGTGLNLTRANHVFHYDRWWNPAVEQQATDRAFRIGQTQNVQVHKLISSGTLEERIDDMIESKRLLAEQIVGTGESWMTEMSTEDLKELFALRREAVMDE
jgi:SNF2 family DNA or RNA helicase